jgi:hypothetical protein
VNPTELPAEVREALEAILAYCWDDEREDAQGQYHENDGNLSGHIFGRIVTVKNWLEGTNKTPADFLDL